MNRDKNGFAVFDDDFLRERLSKKEFALNKKHSAEFQKLLAEKDNGKISVKEFNKRCREMDARHTADYDALYDEEHGKKNISSAINFVSPIVAGF